MAYVRLSIGVVSLIVLLWMPLDLMAQECKCDDDIAIIPPGYEKIEVECDKCMTGEGYILQKDPRFTPPKPPPGDEQPSIFKQREQEKSDQRKKKEKKKEKRKGNKRQGLDGKR